MSMREEEEVVVEVEKKSRPSLVVMDGKMEGGKSRRGLRRCLLDAGRTTQKDHQSRTNQEMESSASYLLPLVDPSICPSSKSRSTHINTAITILITQPDSRQIPQQPNCELNTLPRCDIVTLCPLAKNNQHQPTPTPERTYLQHSQTSLHKACQIRMHNWLVLKFLIVRLKRPFVSSEEVRSCPIPVEREQWNCHLYHCMPRQYFYNHLREEEDGSWDVQ